jgi:hypothetical protein
MTLPSKLALIGATLWVAACASNRTTIQSTWSDHSYSGPPLDRIAVVALFETRVESLAFEEEAAEYLASQGVAAVPAHEIVTAAELRSLDEAEIRERLAATDVDGVLIVRLIAVDERREYQVPTPYLLNVPAGIMGSDPFWWYYQPRSSYYWFWRSSADVVGSPGYWTEQTFLIAESALFDNHTDRLLWTAKSETMDDVRFERASESIVRSVARELFATDLISRIAHGRSASNAVRQMTTHTDREVRS